MVTFEQCARRGELREMTLRSNVLFCSGLIQSPEQHQNQEHLTSFKSNWTKNRLLSLACLQTSEVSLFFSIFSCWFNMFPPVLITTSDLFVTEQTPNANTGWSNRDEALMRNKTFYSYFIWSHFLWRTCATRCLSILACWLMYAFNAF